MKACVIILADTASKTKEAVSARTITCAHTNAHTHTQVNGPQFVLNNALSQFSYKKGLYDSTYTVH